MTWRAISVRPDLGRHPLGGTRVGLGGEERLVLHAAQAEVADLHDPVLVDEEVWGLDLAAQVEFESKV